MWRSGCAAGRSARGSDAVAGDDGQDAQAELVEGITDVTTADSFCSVGGSSKRKDASM